jgi:hypothetical protein
VIKIKQFRLGGKIVSDSPRCGVLAGSREEGAHNGLVFKLFFKQDKTLLLADHIIVPFAVVGGNSAKLHLLTTIDIHDEIAS